MQSAPVNELVNPSILKHPGAFAAGLCGYLDDKEEIKKDGEGTCDTPCFGDDTETCGTSRRSPTSSYIARVIHPQMAILSVSARLGDEDHPTIA